MTTIGMILLLAVAAAPADTGNAASSAASLAGVYDGGQTEMAAQLELDADGRFRYGMIYGALDEMAEGTWMAASDHVLLTSDPVNPPRFLFLGQAAGEKGRLQVSLDLPTGFSRQYFDVMVDFAQGPPSRAQMGEDGLDLPFGQDNPPVAASMVLPLFDVRSEPARIDPAKGYAMAFRFEPNDLGKVDFKGTALKIERGDLLLERHERLIRFRRQDQR